MTVYTADSISIAPPTVKLLSPTVLAVHITTLRPMQLTAPLAPLALNVTSLAMEISYIPFLAQRATIQRKDLNSASLAQLVHTVLMKQLLMKTSRRCFVPSVHSARPQYHLLQLVAF